MRWDKDPLTADEVMAVLIDCSLRWEPKPNPLTDALEAARAQLGRYQPIVRLTIDYDGSAECAIWAGDANCPHAKPYDPNDGHGYTHVTTEDQLDGMPENGFNAYQAIRVAVRMFEKEYEPCDSTNLTGEL